MISNTRYDSIIENLQLNRKWFLILGVLLVIGGILALTNVVAATVFTMYFLGGFLIASGVFQFIHSFQVKQTSLFFFALLWSVVYVVAGIYILAVPIGASAILTLFLGCVLIAFGVSRLISGITLRKMAGSRWLLLTAIVDLIFGFLIITGWPTNSLFLFGIFLAIDLLIQGSCLIMVYFAIRRSHLNA